MVYDVILDQASTASESLRQLKWLLTNDSQEESATNGVTIKFYINNISRRLRIVVILSTSIQYQHFNTLNKCPLLQVNNQQIRQASDILSISEQYTAHNSTILWYPINFRAIYIPSLNKPLILYQFQSNIQPSIQQASDIISIS